MSVSQEMIERLLSAGLTRSQATSKTAEVITDLYAENAGLALSEAKRQIEELEQMALQTRRKVNEAAYRNEAVVERVDALLTQIEELNKTGTEMETERARDCIRSFEFMMRLAASYKCDMDEALHSFMIYAMLGGQATRVYEDGGG